MFKIEPLGVGDTVAADLCRYHFIHCTVWWSSQLW